MVLALGIEDSFFEWLRARTRDSTVSQIDAFSDVTLDRAMQERWLRALQQVEDDYKTQLEAEAGKTSRLPKDSAARAQVLANLVREAVRRQPMMTVLAQLKAAIELSRENGAIIRAWGD